MERVSELLGSGKYRRKASDTVHKAVIMLSGGREVETPKAHEKKAPLRGRLWRRLVTTPNRPCIAHQSPVVPLSEWLRNWKSVTRCW